MSFIISIFVTKSFKTYGLWVHSLFILTKSKKETAVCFINLVRNMWYDTFCELRDDAEECDREFKFVRRAQTEHFIIPSFFTQSIFYYLYGEIDK